MASIPYTISAVLSPILGLCVDRFGKRAFVITLAPLLLILVHLMLGLSTSISPAVPLIGQGLAYRCVFRGVFRNLYMHRRRENSLTLGNRFNAIF